MVNHPACIHIGQSFACLRGQAFISIAQPGGHSFCLDLIVRHEPDVSPALLDFCLPGHPPPASSSAVPRHPLRREASWPRLLSGELVFPDPRTWSFRYFRLPVMFNLLFAGAEFEHLQAGLGRSNLASPNLPLPGCLLPLFRSLIYSPIDHPGIHQAVL